MSNDKKAKEIPIYLMEIRNKLIKELAEKGISTGDISKLFSGKMKINRSRVHQIINDQ